MENILPEILKTEHWKIISNRVKDITLDHCFPYIPEYKKTQRSNYISCVFETQAAHYFNEIGIECDPGKIDKDPDLLFTKTNEVCEIKVTSSKKQEWMGGKHSKRSAEYILVSWQYIPSGNTVFGYVEENIEFSIINTYLHMNDWNVLGKNFSGTKITSKLLKDKTVKVIL